LPRYFAKLNRIVSSKQSYPYLNKHHKVCGKSVCGYAIVERTERDADCYSGGIKNGNKWSCIFQILKCAFLSCFALLSIENLGFSVEGDDLVQWK